MGHSRIIIVIALLAGCAVDAASPGEPFTLEGTGPEDQVTCMDWADYGSIWTRKSNKWHDCWLGGAEDRGMTVSLQCAQLPDGTGPFACVESRSIGERGDGKWYSFEGGTVERVALPGGSFAGPVDAEAVVYTGPTFVEHECAAGMRSPLLDVEWCAE